MWNIGKESSNNVGSCLYCGYYISATECLTTVSQTLVKMSETQWRGMREREFPSKGVSISHFHCGH